MPSLLNSIGTVLVSFGLLTCPAFALDTDKPIGEKRHEELATKLATRLKLPADHLATQIIAASAAYRMYPDGQGRFKIMKDDFIQRLVTRHNEYKQIEQAIDRSKVPASHKDSLKSDYARQMLWPIRFRSPPPPTKAWIAHIATIPSGHTLVTVDEQHSLTKHLTKLDPNWASRSPLLKKSVLDHLLRYNPRLRYDGGFHDQNNQQQDGSFPTEEPDVRAIGMYGQLAELVPAIGFEQARQYMEQICIPHADKGQWVCRYRLSSGEVLLPDSGTLRSWLEQPATLDLRNIPFGDISSLKGMPVQKLDLSSTQVSDVSALASMKQLRQLRLSNCPVQDISALQGCPLELLDLRGSQVSDLQSLAGLPIKQLDLRDAPITNLGPLAKMPLTLLLLTEDGNYENLDVLESISSLKGKIEDIPMSDWLAEHASKRQNPFWDDASSHSCSGLGAGAGDCGPGDKQKAKPTDDKTKKDKGKNEKAKLAGDKRKKDDKKAKSRPKQKTQANDDNIDDLLKVD